MANKKNIVKFNLCNVHYSVLTQSEDGKYSWGTPVSVPGAVSISLDPTGEPESFYADGVEYYVINNNQGYDGDLELAMIPEDFRKDVLNEVSDSNSVVILFVKMDGLQVLSTPRTFYHTYRSMN